jgi:hypothetical protein
VTSHKTVFSSALPLKIHPYGWLAFAMLLPALLWAQISAPIQKTMPESPRIFPADAVQIIDPALTDSSHLVHRRKNSIDSGMTAVFLMPRTGFRMDTAATSTHLFQDFLHLVSQTLPITPIFTGEVGQPRYLTAGDLPARAAQIVVDGVWWIPGVYGNVDLTGLPDGNVEVLEESEASIRNPWPIFSPYTIRFAVDSLNYNMPFSRIEYAKGPFGADAVRFRFGRALSQRLTTFLNGTFSNSDQAYDGHKASAQFDYRMSSRWRLSYRHLNSRNEAEILAPFFPEEWPGITESLHKEERLYHALEVSSASKLMWRGFLWQVKEELNDPDHPNRHRLRDGGMEMRWQTQRDTWGLTIHNRLGLEQIKSGSIRDHERFYDQLVGMVGIRLNQKMWFQLAGQFAYKADWPQGSALQARWMTKPSHSISWWLAGGKWKIPPALGERENSLPQFARNDDLQAVDLWRGEFGMAWQSPRFDWQIRLSDSHWKNGMIFRTDSKTSFGLLRNSERSKTVFAAQMSLRWEFAPRWYLAAISAQALNNLPRHFWFWHQPEGYSRFYLETLQSFFNGDLEILPRIAGRFIDRRYSPSFATDEISLLSHELPTTAVLDLQIRLRHGDGALLFSWENVLNRQFEWRYGVPAVGRFLRWGFWWNFWN